MLFVDTAILRGVKRHARKGNGSHRQAVGKVVQWDPDLVSSRIPTGDFF